MLRLDATPDANQSTGDGANHLVEEAVSFDFNMQLGWPVGERPVDIDGKDGPHAAVAVGATGLETAKIVRADQYTAGTLHRFFVQGIWQLPRIAAGENVAIAVVANHI